MADPAVRVTMLLRNPFTVDSRVEKEALSLTKAGYQVTVVAEGRPDLPDRDERDGYTVLRVPRGPARLPGLRMRQYGGRLEAALRATDPDILHAHDSDALGAVARVARHGRLPFVYDAHELWLGQENRGRSRLYFTLFRIYYWWLQRRVVRRAAATITVSAPIAAALRRAYGVSAELVANYPVVDREPQHRELRDILSQPIPPQAPIILYVGNIQPARGLEELVIALADVPDAYLVVLGSATPPRSLTALARGVGVADRLRFVAPVPDSEVMGYAASAALGVSLATPVSRNNRFSLPNKLFQYMAAGIAVVASDFEQVRDVVVTTGAGVTVDPTDTTAIADALKRLLADPARAAEMGRRGRAAILERFNWSVSETTLLAVYARIAREVTR